MPTGPGSLGYQSGTEDVAGGDQVPRKSPLRCSAVLQDARDTGAVVGLGGRARGILSKPQCMPACVQPRSRAGILVLVKEVVEGAFMGERRAELFP
jgi:hypothetical protein